MSIPEKIGAVIFSTTGFYISADQRLTNRMSECINDSIINASAGNVNKRYTIPVCLLIGIGCVGGH